MSTTFAMNLNLGGFDAAVDGMQQDLQKAIRPASQAAAQLIYEDVLRHVPRRSGKLAQAIYQAYSKTASTDGKAVYHVSWNAKKAPHGHLVEFGHLQRYELIFNPETRRFFTDKTKKLATPIQIPARPFIRPALSKMAAAQDAAEKIIIRALSAS